MNYEENSRVASIWEQRKSRLEGTALEDGKLLNPEFYMHLLDGCAYDPGEIVGTPAFINTYKLSEPFRRDLAAHLSRIDVEYYPPVNREYLITNNADENIIITFEGELTLCMLSGETAPIVDRLLSHSFEEINAIPAKERRPELNAWIVQFNQEIESYDDDIYWDDDDDNCWED